MQLVFPSIIIVLIIMGCSDSKLHPTSTIEKRLRVNSQHSTTESEEVDSAHPSPTIVRAVFLGDASVGKSSLSMRYFHDEFKQTYNITFGGIFFKKEVKVSKDLSISLQAWDTGGEERYRSMAPLYYRNASIAFLVCSLADQNPISSLDYWHTELSQKVSKDNISIIVLANKADLSKTQESAKIEQWCKANGIQYFQCSAKTGKGVQEAFQKGIQMHAKKIRS